MLHFLNKMSSSGIFGSIQLQKHECLDDDEERRVSYGATSDGRLDGWIDHFCWSM